MTRAPRTARDARGNVSWRVTFVDSVTSRRIEIDVCAPDLAGAHERGWAALRAARPPGVVAVELVDARLEGGLGRHERQR
jgi:hypothetical protein